MIKNKLLGILGAIGLAAAPAVAPTVSEAPTPAQAPAPAHPAAKTDGRATKYYTPKGMQSKRSRLTRFTKAVFGEPRGCNRNRFARRAVCKAAMEGRGRLVKGFPLESSVTTRKVRAVGAEGVTEAHIVTTRRAVERAKKIRDYAIMLNARQTAARVLASSEEVAS